MKKSLILAFILAAIFSFTSLAFSQTDVSTQGGTLHSTALETLATSGSPVIAVSLPGQSLVTGNLGTLTFTTPALASGDFQTGGTFGAGGLLVIDAPGYVDYVGNLASATWTDTILANGNHVYTLTGNLTSTEGAASFYCLMVALPKKAMWNKSAKIATCEISIQ